jgi:hypothetical protein
MYVCLYRSRMTAFKDLLLSLFLVLVNKLDLCTYRLSCEVLEAAIIAVLADTVGMGGGWRLFQRQQKVCPSFLLLFYAYLLL